MKEEINLKFSMIRE